MKVQNPLIGRSSGKVGNVIGQKWKNLNIIRTKPIEVANPRTEKQQANRNAMTLLNKALRLNLVAIRKGYLEQKATTPGWSLAIQQNRLNAITLTPPTASLDVTAVTVSKGSLLPALGLTATINGGDIDLAWTNNENGVTGFGTDILVIAGVTSGTGEATGGTVTTFTRADASGTLVGGAGSVVAGDRFIGFFINSEGTKSSDSLNIAIA